MLSWKTILCSLALLTAWSSAQNTQADTAHPDPPVTQIRKSVVFIMMICGEGTKKFDVRGTGFLVSYPDPRVGEGFSYLVTNRHVALCWNATGHAMQVESISLRLNRKTSLNGIFSQDVFLNEHGNVSWVLPPDDSVDLAAFPLLPNENVFDFVELPISMFAKSDFLSQQRVTEGEPVFFAGFFQQFPGTKRMQPIVRQGILAMMPEEKIPFVGKAEKVYLADIHVFGGNSGAPAFINLGGFHHGSMKLGDEYRLLGIVNGYLFENEHFDLELATTFLGGTGRANSGISTIVPADELIALLDDPRFKTDRDTSAKARESTKK